MITYANVLDVPRSARNLPETFTPRLRPSLGSSKQASKVHGRTDHGGPDHDERSAHVDVPERAQGVGGNRRGRVLQNGGDRGSRSRGCLAFTGKVPGERFSSCAA